MDKIIFVFRPWLDTIPNLDYTKTKLGWARVTNLPYEEQIQFLQGPENMLCALAGDFFDRAEGRTTGEAAANALEAMRPYLLQLPPALAEYAVTALEVYAKLDDL